jgi:hypothetical protein
MSDTRSVASLSQRVSGSSAELGELTVDLGEAERLGFLRVLLGWVLDRGVALVRHADRVRLVWVEREHQHSGEAVLLPGIGQRLADGAQFRELRIEQDGIARRPAF